MGGVRMHRDRSKVTTIENGERKEGCRGGQALGLALFNKSECFG